jgi:hypothetical protein
VSRYATRRAVRDSRWLGVDVIREHPVFLIPLPLPGRPQMSRIVEVSKAKQRAAREAKQRVLAQLSEELPKMIAARPRGTKLSAIRTLANLADQLTKTYDWDIGTIARIIQRIEAEMETARR